MNCASNGCNIADSETASYWTGSASAHNYDCAWNVGYNGDLYTGVIFVDYYGLRPVITISKSNL